MKPLFAGNWKMHMLREDAAQYLSSFLELLESSGRPEADIWFAAPLTSLPTVADALCEKREDQVLVGAQNVHWLGSGAHTGEHSAAMLQDVGARFAIVGHSERRAYYGETDETVAQRALAAIEAGLIAVVCVGETEAEYRAERTDEVVKASLAASLAGLEDRQVERLVVAYEPVWAIGTGLAATPEIAGRVHSLIRQQLGQIFSEDLAVSIRILYGGSAKPENIGELCAQEHVNGALVGGASLKPDVFYELASRGAATSE